MTIIATTTPPPFSIAINMSTKIKIKIYRERLFQYAAQMNRLKLYLKIHERLSLDIFKKELRKFRLYLQLVFKYSITIIICLMNTLIFYPIIVTFLGHAL